MIVDHMKVFIGNMLYKITDKFDNRASNSLILIIIFIFVLEGYIGSIIGKNARFRDGRSFKITSDIRKHNLKRLSFLRKVYVSRFFFIGSIKLRVELINKA